MDLSREALAFLAEHFKPTQLLVELADGTNRSITDRKFFPPPLPPQEPLPTTLELRSLGSLIDLCSSESTDLPDGWFLHLSPEAVSLNSPLFGYHQQRKLVARAIAPTMPPAPNGSTILEAIVWLNACCQEAGDRAVLLALLSSVTEQELEVHEDDGTSQRVTTDSGLRLKTTEKTKNPVMLAPYRTFPEVPQVLSEFLFRVEKGPNGPRIFLIPADGEMWKNNCCNVIREYLEGKWNGEEPLRVLG